MISQIERQLGNYRLTRLLGKGGFADVYYGEHMYLQTAAAIKVLNMRITHEEREKFLAEARIAARLSHPHIVAVLEFGIENDTPYLVMDYAAHGTLRQRYPKGMRRLPQQCLPYVQQIASALQYTHEQQLVHRDVKPENMLLSGDNSVLLSDFGIARIVQQTQQANNERHMVGTIAYMAPEQLRGDPCPASDQYALGAVIYEWLCGSPVFSGSFTEIAIQHALVPPIPLRERIPYIHKDVEEVVMIALRKDAQERFKSMRAFANAFGQACEPFVEWVSEDVEASVLMSIAGKVLPKKGFSRRSLALGLLAGAGSVATGTLAWQLYGRDLLQSFPGAKPTVQTRLPAPGTTLYTYHAANGYFPAIVWLRDSKRIASIGDSVQVWHAASGKVERVYQTGLPWISIGAMAWSSDNKYIAVGIFQKVREIWIWDAQTGKRLFVYAQSVNNLRFALAWSPDNTYIASTGGADRTLEVWHALTGKVQTSYPMQTDTINTIAWSSDGTLIASADGTPLDVGGAGSVHVWEAATGRTRLIYRGHPDHVAAVAWSPNGKFIASAGGSYSPTQPPNPNNNTVQIWQPNSDKPLVTYREHPGPVRAVAWSPDSKYIVSSCNTQLRSEGVPIQVWHAADGRTLLSYKGDPYQSYDRKGSAAVAWSPDGSMIASTGLGGTVLVWKAL